MSRIPYRTRRPAPRHWLSPGRTVLALAVLEVSFVVALVTAAAEERRPAPSPAVQVKASVAWLVKHQERDGSWASGLGDNQPALVVTTSFCALALMAHGDTRDLDVPVRKAVNFVNENLFESNPAIKLPPEWDQSNWKIAIGGLFLCEYYARLKARDPKFRLPSYEAILQRCADEAIKRMEPSGGWGHTPTVKNPLGYVELEVLSNWMLPMLAACKSLGCKVPAEKLELAMQFVQDCCADGQGSVGYSSKPPQRGVGDASRTGGAIFAFAMLGQRRTQFYGRMTKSFTELDDAGEGHGSVAMGYLSTALGARALSDATHQKFAATHYPTILKAASLDGSFKHIKGTTPKATGFDDKLGAAYNTGVYALLLQLDGKQLAYLGR